MGIDHCGANVGVAQQLLDGPNVVTFVQQVGCKRVAETVAATCLGNPGLTDCRLYDPLNGRLIDMVAGEDFRDGIFASSCGGEDELPIPLSGGIRKLCSERVGKNSFAESFLNVFLMDGVDFLEMELQSFLYCDGEDGRAVFVSFAASDHDPVLGEVDVFDTEAEAFEQSESRAIEEVADDPVDAFKVGDDLFGFFAGKHFGDAFWASCTDNVRDVPQFFVDDFLVEKEDSVEREVLGGSCYIFFDGEECKKVLDFFFSHLRRMAFPIIENEPFDPVDVSILGATGEVFELHLVPHLIQQLRWIHRTSEE